MIAKKYIKRKKLLNKIALTQRREGGLTIHLVPTECQALD